MSRSLKTIVATFAVLALGWAGAAQAGEVYAGHVLAESGGTSHRVKIIVNEFTRPEETARLQAVLREKGERGDDGSVKLENLEARPRRIFKVSRSE